MKELLQHIVKVKGKLGKGTEMIDKIPGVEEEINFLGTPPFPVPDKKSIGPQLIQPPEGKKPHVKPIEVGGGPQWPSKPSTSTTVRGTGGTKGQPPDKPTKGVPSTGRGESNRNQREDQPQSRPPPKDDGEEAEMVMVRVVVEMVMMMMMNHHLAQELEI